MSVFLALQLPHQLMVLLVMLVQKVCIVQMD
jgi:hypothetical protein